MNLFKTSLLATAVALTFGVSGANAEDHKDHTGPERTVGQAVDDATITASGQMRAAVSNVGDTAGTMAARAKAIEIAHATEGVNSVVATQLAVQ